MKYNPEKHHRRSIRLKGYDYSSPGAYFITLCTYKRECLFGEIIQGEMQLNQFGKIVRSHWQKLPKYYPHLQLDKWIIMPNHLHGILILTYHDVGTGLDNSGSIQPVDPMTNSALVKASTFNKRFGIPEIVRGFKTFSARRINQVRNVKGLPVWQRNYYEHIIRNKESLQNIRQYIDQNPISWQQDQIHSGNQFP